MTNAERPYDFVMRKLREKPAPRRKIASDSGVPYSTLTKIAQGAIMNPSVHTIQQLVDYFSGNYNPS